MRRLARDKDFGYVCTITLTLKKRPRFKVMTHPWVMDNNCVKYHPDRTREYEAMSWTLCEQTDGQTDGQGESYIPPNFVLGGYKYKTFKGVKRELLHRKRKRHILDNPPINSKCKLVPIECI